MLTEYYLDSCGSGRIHCCCWTPAGEVRAIVQIVHGIAEYAARYAPFAEYLNGLGVMVVAEDHMGHGGSISDGAPQGYFSGGWFSAVEDCYQLLIKTRAEYPQVPYFLFGHSMGSFMARTLIARYPQSGIRGAVICGTGWMSTAVLKAGKFACELTCKFKGERTADKGLNGLVFSGYNRKVEHPRTAYDWLNRDTRCVDAYVADPLCGFVPTAGLLRDMLAGILHIQKRETLEAMDKNLPVFFIAGGADPVGDYGKGVMKAVQAFRQTGMNKVTHKLYPMYRHEILNEWNKEEVWGDISMWIQEQMS